MNNPINDEQSNGFLIHKPTYLRNNTRLHTSLNPINEQEQSNGLL